MNSKIEATIEKWKKRKFITWLVFVSGITEEILKQRRRTSLVFGGAITLLVYYLLSK